MPVSPIAVANFFLEKSFATGVGVTPIQIIKMVYIAHGWYLANTNEPLIDEAIQAWKFGPVVESVYHKFSNFRDAPITQMAQEFSGNGQMVLPTIADQGLREFLSQVWDIYSKYSGWQLSALTHEKGTPWDTTWNIHGGRNRHGAIIPNGIISDHYKEKMSGS